MNELFYFEETERFGLRKGIVFYFDDQIDREKICVLEEIIAEFLLMTHAEFTKKRGGNDYPNRRNIRGGWQKIFHREFDGKEFTESHTLELDDCAPQKLQTIYTHIAPSNYKNQLKSPAKSYFAYSYLYFQCPLDTEWSAIYQFIQSASNKLNIHYASAGYEMAYNPLYYPGSEGSAVRALNDLAYVNSEATEWEHLFLSTRFGVPCPNFIQLLGPDLLPETGCDLANGIHAKRENGHLFLDILDRTPARLCEPTSDNIKIRYRDLYQFLRPVMVAPQRSMFMKKGDWEKRLRRFEAPPDSRRG